METKKLVLAAAATMLVLLAALAVTLPGRPRLVIATTTSTVDSGLLDFLKPYFDDRFHADITWLYLGTGQALAVASRGDADVLLVHGRAREDAFVRSGNGTHRVTVMYNDFVVVGPELDEAGVADAPDAADAFNRIATAGESGRSVFVSRGDGSGTNALELRIWSKAGVDPKERAWYLEAGQGMAPTIRIADEKLGYTVSDRATWLKLKSEMEDSLRLAVLYEGAPDLMNPYGLIQLNQTRYPNTNWQLAEKFILFMVSEEGQELIAEFEVGGEQLFFPVFGRTESVGLPPEAQEVQYWIQRLRDNNMNPPRL